MLTSCAISSCGPPSWPGGIHVLLGWSAARVRVVDVPADGPAARAGLLPGDVIVAIEGAPLAGLSAAAVHARLRGEVGSKVHLTVLRDGVERVLAVPRTPYAHGAARR
jgi:carboxyl-terminal processing protease